MHKPWVEKYRPEYLKDVICPPPQLEDIINKGALDFPNLLFVGAYGVGKTTMAYVLENELKAELWKPAERTIDTVREMPSFINKLTKSTMKLILLDEADKFTPPAQNKLREVMELQGDTRFILTTNHINEIIPAIQSRCTLISFNTIILNEYKNRLKYISQEENVNISDTVLDKIVSENFPDFRRGINALFLFHTTGKYVTSVDLVEHIVSLVLSKDIKEIRRVLVNQAIVDYESLLVGLFDYFFEKDNKENALVIYRGLVNHVVVAEPLVNFLATCMALK